MSVATAGSMRILIVKLSSLGDVVHTLPVAVDLQRAFPNAQIDWVLERGFAPLVQRCQAVSRVIPLDLRRWRQQPFASQTRMQWHAFRAELTQTPYDAVLDLQGLTKSAWIAWLARLSPNGKRYAMANRTDGSGYERTTRWVADVAIDIEPHIHAMVRGRQVAARALGYQPDEVPDFGLRHAPTHPARAREVVLVHGTSRADKEWPFQHWVDLGHRLQQAGHSLAIPHGNAREHERAQQLAQALPGSNVWPADSLDALTERMAQSGGVIGVDSGLSHIAVALNLPHVQIYNFDTAWRTGPLGAAHQRAVFAKPAPSVETVWQAWQSCASSLASDNAWQREGGA